MGQALYRKYRSKSFAEVVGQEHITKTLSRAIKSGRISHAYLFTGPRGVGKTSVARILAHEVNKLPYTDESIHLDIIEIDAASNRRIDEVRDLRDRVRIAPSSAKYKVYIIDEVHMLTREAFNALLKTLEEPPAHCIFILATTEAHKLPETIVSRTQRFEFKPVGPRQAAEHLSNIAKSEKIDISKEALNLLAEFGEGSFRDSISYLDQLSTLGKKITEEDVRDLLGLPSKQEIQSILKHVRAGDSPGVLNDLQNIKEQGVSAAVAAAALAKELRQKLIEGESNSWVTTLLKQLIEVPASARPHDNLEIILLEASTAHLPTGNRPASANTPAAAKPVVRAAIKPVELKVEVKPEPQNPAPANSGRFDISQWDAVVLKAKDEAASIYTALRLATPSISENGLLLAFRFPLHQKKIMQAKNKGLVSQLIEDICGVKIAIECVVDKTARPPAEAKKPERNDASLETISNIFGAGEVLKS